MTKGRDGTKKATAARPAPKRPAKTPAPKASAPKPTKPARPAVARPAAKPAARPSAGPVAKTAPKPTARAAGKSSAKPVGKSPAKPAARPAARPAAKPATATKPAARPAAPVVPARPVKKAEAPKPFQREYRKWVERLISLRQRLVVEGERLGEEGLKALEQEVSVDHMADYGSDSYEQDTTLSLIENKSEALRDVDEALRRIEAKTYGLCEECEQLIPAGRLEVLPHARYCVTCQAAREGTV